MGSGVLARGLFMPLVVPLLVSGTCFWSLEAVFARLRGVSSVRCVHVWMRAGIPVAESVERVPVEKMEAVRFDWTPSEFPPRDVVQVLLAVTSAQLVGWEVLNEFSGNRSLIAGIPAPMLTDFERSVAVLQEELEARSPTEKLHTQCVSWMPSHQEAFDFDRGYFDRLPADGFSCSIIAPKIAKVAKMFPHALATVKRSPSSVEEG